MSECQHENKVYAPYPDYDVRFETDTRPVLFEWICPDCGTEGKTEGPRGNGDEYRRLTALWHEKRGEHEQI